MKLRVDDLHVHDIIHGVSLEARPGEVLAILGPSGAGKTTLLRVLHLLRRPDAGRVLVDGAVSPPGRDVLARYGLVQQRPGLLARRVVDNVAWPLVARGVPRAEASERALAALDRLHLPHRAEAHARTLSGGEAQRAALARAVVGDPDVLLLDEFTNNQDPDMEALCEEVVEDVRDGGATAVVVTHGVGQARRLADDVVFLDKGRVVEAGVAGEVLGAPRTELVRRFVARA